MPQAGPIPGTLEAQDIAARAFRAEIFRMKAHAARTGLPLDRIVNVLRAALSEEERLRGGRQEDRSEN